MFFLKFIKQRNPSANWKSLLKPSVNAFYPSDPYACIPAKEGCSVKDSVQIWKTFSSQYFGVITSINTGVFPVFVWSNFKFLYTVTVNEIISLNALKVRSTLKAQNSEGFVQICSLIIAIADHLLVLLKKSGCMQYWRINLSWRGFSSSRRARSSNSKGCKVSPPGFQYYHPFRLELIVLHCTYLEACEESDQHFSHVKHDLTNGILHPKRILDVPHFLLITSFCWWYLEKPCNAGLSFYYYHEDLSI